MPLADRTVQTDHARGRGCLSSDELQLPHSFLSESLLCAVGLWGAEGRDNIFLGLEGGHHSDLFLKIPQSRSK
jgi:hypothetical protein